MAFVELPSIRVDVERARALILSQGGALEQARLAGILGAVGPDRELVRSLERRQNPDGGFPADDGGESDIAATCTMLNRLLDLPPLAGSPMASRAVAYLRRSQAPDGSWAAPGSDAPSAALTAQAAYTALMLEPEQTGPIARAAAWLRSALPADGAGQEADAGTLARAWAIWHRQAGPRAPEARWALESLLARELSPAERAGWLDSSLAVDAGGPLLLPLLQRLAQLAGAQQADGAWPGGMEVTLAVLRVMRGFGLA